MSEFSGKLATKKSDRWLYFCIPWATPLPFCNISSGTVDDLVNQV